MNKKDVEARISGLLEKMTLEEKIGQLVQSGPSLVGGFTVPVEELFAMAADGRISPEEFQKQMEGAKEDIPEDEIRKGSVGSFLGVTGAKNIARAQKIAVEESRLGIPVLAGFDVVHGFKTVFPIPLAESCSFDEALFEETARIAADEASAAGIHWVFAPMIDVARDARWGRVSEGAGEDPYLTSVFARAKVKGFQGNDPGAYDKVLACPKHFLGYSGAEGGRDYNCVDAGPEKILNVFYPPFKAAIEAGAQSIMPSFNTLNGVPNTVNRELLMDFLKTKEGFEGVLLSDANAVKECVEHGVAGDLKDAARLAINGGMDVEMISPCYKKYLKELVEEGAVSMERIDDAVSRVLRLKFAKGLFDHPVMSDADREAATLLKKEYVDAARRAAVRSIVLLKNDGILPLGGAPRIGLAGPLADMPLEMLGSWALEGEAEHCVSIRQGLENAFPGCEYRSCMKALPDASNDAARLYGQLCPEDIKALQETSDVLVAVVGELKAMSGEAASRSDLTLPGAQEALVAALKATGLPVVVLLVNGRPLVLNSVNDHANAIVECWHLGIQAGNAVADILSGRENPSGRLSISFPESSGQCPVYYNHLNTGRPAGQGSFSSKYIDVPWKLKYPFGYGLSYTDFDYTKLKVRVDDAFVHIQVDVENMGKLSGEETVQFYFQDVVASVAQPVKRLFAFQKLTLKPGEKKKVHIQKDKRSFGFYDHHGSYCLEDGAFKFFAGKNSQEVLEAEIKICF